MITALDKGTERVNILELSPQKNIYNNKYYYL